MTPEQEFEKWYETYDRDGGGLMLFNAILSIGRKNGLKEAMSVANCYHGSTAYYIKDAIRQRIEELP